MAMYHDDVANMLAGLRGEMRANEEQQAEIEAIVAGLKETAVSEYETVRREVQDMFEELFAATHCEELHGIAITTEFSERTHATTGAEENMIPVHVDDMQFSTDPEQYREQLTAATIRELAGWLCDHNTSFEPTHGFVMCCVELARAVDARTEIAMNADDIINMSVWGLPPLMSYINACAHPPFIFWFDLMQFRDSVIRLEGANERASSVLTGLAFMSDVQATADDTCVAG